MFDGCTNVKKVTFGKNIHCVGDGAFENCVSLDHIVWNSIFLECNDYTDYSIDLHAVYGYVYENDPYHEGYGGLGSFDVANNIKTLELGEEARYIPWRLKGYYAENNSLTSVISKNPLPPSFQDVRYWNNEYEVMYNDFDGVVYENAVLQVPPGYKSVYQSADDWKKFKHIEEFVGDIKGDINSDGSVDIADVNLCINTMLGKADQTAAADVSGDGAVDIADVNAVINLMLGK